MAAVAARETYGTERASRLFTTAARNTDESPAVLREPSEKLSRLQRILERMESRYPMEATGYNHFKMADTNMEDFIEISNSILGEYILFSVKESHQYSKRTEVRYENLRIQIEFFFQIDYKLKNLANEINMAHEHENFAVTAAQAARETLASEGRRNNDQALVMDEDMRL